MGDKICGQKTDTATQIDPVALQLFCLKKATNGGGDVNRCLQFRPDIEVFWCNDVLLHFVLVWKKNKSESREVAIAKVPVWHASKVIIHRKNSMFTKKSIWDRQRMYFQVTCTSLVAEIAHANEIYEWKLKITKICDERIWICSCFTGQVRYQYRANSNAASVNKTFFVFFQLMKMQKHFRKGWTIWLFLVATAYVEGQ